MKLLSYKLKGYVPFKFSKIDSLSLSYPEDIQIILGTNGSGKSSYLRTLTPYPISRSFFNKDGYREMVLEHEGHVYTLISDFSNKASPHQFIKDDEGDLNEGGTTGVQNELVESYLGITKERESLLFGDVSFCDMTPSQVKPFLMKICPLDLGWILDKQKKTSSTLRNIKAELKYLTTRETQLLSELSDEEELNQMKTDKEAYQKKITQLIADKAALETKIDLTLSRRREFIESARQTTGKSIDTVTSTDLEVFEFQIGQLKDKLSGNVEIDNWISSRADIFSDEHIGKISIVKTHLEEELSQYHDRLRDIEQNLAKSNSENVEELTLTLESLKTSYDEGKANIISDALSEDDVLYIENSLPKLNDLILALDGEKRNLWSRSHYSRKLNHYNRISQKAQIYTSELSSVQSSIESLETQLNNGFDPNITPCAKHQCVLFRFATEKRSEREDNLKSLKLRAHKLNKWLSKYSPYLEARHLNFRIRENDNKILEELFSLINTCPPLRRYLDKDILRVLSQTPHKLYRDILAHVESSRKTNELKAIERKIQECQTRLNDVSKVSQSYKDYLIKDKETLLKSISDTEDKLKVSERDYKALQYLEDRKDTQKAIETLTQQRDTLKRLVKERNEMDLEISTYRTSLTPIEESLEKTMRTLTQIELVLSNQEKILSRYEEEVKSRLTDLSTKLAHYTDLEYAQIEMPKRYMQQWLSALVEQVNKYISVVWKQQLELQVPKDDKEYRFTALFKGDVIENLSLCSSAQKDIINLCMCLALRSPVTSLDGIGMRGYPLALDETGATFDEAHKHNLIDLFTLLIGEGIVSQIYLTSHHAVIHGALANIQTLVLNADNIALPASYNQDVDIVYK